MHGKSVINGRVFIISRNINLFFIVVLLSHGFVRFYEQLFFSIANQRMDVNLPITVADLFARFAPPDLSLRGGAEAVIFAALLALLQ